MEKNILNPNIHAWLIGSRKQKGKKPGGKYIESKHLSMVNGAKKPDRICI